MPFAVLRIQKLKSWGSIAGAGKHNQRERETPNADEKRTENNQVLIGSAEKDNVHAIKESIGAQRIRKNAVLAVEMLLSASPDYFRPNAPEQAGTYDTDRLKNWTKATAEWLQERYGNRIVSATLHLDEATPHMHALLVPLDDKGKLNCRALFGGSKHTLSLLQTDYAEAVAHVGIERGIINSRATHQKVSQFYSLALSKDGPELPMTQTYDAPEMPNKLTRMSDERLKLYEREAATRGAKAQRETLAEVVRANRNENAVLKKENLQLKKANSRLTQEKTAMQKQLDRARSLDLGLVLNKVFRAKGPYGPGDGHPNRYILPDKREVFISGTNWKIDPAKRGKGAIDLVMALRGYGQNQLTKAIGELAFTFGEEKVTGECAAQAIDQAAQTVRSAVKEFTPEKEQSRSQGQGRSRGISR